MRRYYLALLLILTGALSCEKLRMDPRMIQKFITGEINGVAFKSPMVMSFGGVVRKDMCDKPTVAMTLPKKNGETEYQVILLNYFHAVPGNYVLTDRDVRHKANSQCSMDSIYAELYFKTGLWEDWTTDDYRIVEGPWNYFKVLSYDPEKREIQAEFGAKFVRINKQQHAKEAVDTITYTNGWFILSSMHFNDPNSAPH